MTRLHIWLVAALVLAASAGPASTKVDDHPIVFNAPYTPARNIRPKLAGGRVYVALSHYKGTFYDGATCLVRANEVFAIGPCSAAAQFDYIPLANGFRLRTVDDKKCLGVSGDGISLVADDCTNTLALDAISAGAVIGSKIATGYDRNVLRVGKGAKEYRVFAKASAPAPDLVITADRVEPADIGLGLTITSCLGATCNSTIPTTTKSPKLPAIAQRLADNIAKITPLGHKPNIVLFFVDTLRADAVTPQLAPQITKLANGLPFDRAFAGATSTIQSTYTLLNMRPGFEQEWSVSSDNPQKALFDRGGVAFEILRKLGYKVVLFSRPDWYETFLWSKDLGLESKPYSPTGYSLELPLSTPLTYDKATELADAEALIKSEGRHGITEPSLKYKIKTSALATMTLALHDRLVVDELERYTKANEKALREGGHVLIVYLTGPHAPHVPAESFVKHDRLELPARGDLPADLYLGDEPRTLEIDESLVKTTDALVGEGTKPPPWLAALSEDARRERLAHTYYNQVRLVDAQFGRAMKAYRELQSKDYYIVVMGDHGESLWENGVIFHGGRPAQKVVEAPIVVSRIDGDVSRNVELGSDRTVAQMDLFPALFRDLTGKPNILDVWGIAGDVLDAGRRDRCYISSEPNGSMKSRRFATYDAKTGVKSLFFAADPKGVLDTTSFALTHVTDYSDDPIEASMDQARRCFDIVMSAAYE